MSNTYTMDEYFETRERDQIIDGLLKNIGPSNPLRPHMNVGREEKVIRMLFGLAPYDVDHTFEQVAQAIGVSSERVRQIEAKALRKLRHKTRSKKLRTFLSFDTVKNMELVEIERIQAQKKNQQQILNECCHARWFKRIV